MMISFFKIPCTIVFVLFMIFSEINAKCSSCSTISFAACTDAKTFRMCPFGAMTDQIGHCTGNTVCTDTLGICKENVTGVVLGCETSTIGCNDCNGPFSCISVTEFAYCDANSKIIATSKCEGGKICNSQQFSTSGQICVSTCDNTPTCSNTVATTVAPPAEEYAAICNETTPTGFYPNIDDPTSTQYVYCETVNGTTSAVLFTCPTGYFDPSTKKCGSKKP